MMIKIILLVMMIGIIGILIPRIMTSMYAYKKIYPVENSPKGYRVAIVFGAGLLLDGRPTPVLRDRVTTAVKLYSEGKIEKLLMSGDNRFDYYNEPQAMKTYALELGLPEEAIVLDYAGRRTYDTCYRAQQIFAIQEAILVTQRFHLPRALYTCNQLGLTASGVASDLRQYRRSSLFYWHIRELPATLMALIEIHLLQPKPVLGNPEPIFPPEAQ